MYGRTVKLGVVLAVAAGLGPSPPSLPAVQASAEQFWSARGVVACPRGIQGSYDTDRTRAGHGYGCAFTISTQMLEMATTAQEYRRYSRKAFCAAVYHEVGHALGLDHTADGLMAEDVLTHPEWWPYECRHPSSPPDVR